MPFGTIAKVIKERKRKTAKNREKLGFLRVGVEIASKHAVFESLPGLRACGSRYAMLKKSTGNQEGGHGARDELA